MWYFSSAAIVCVFFSPLPVEEEIRVTDGRQEKMNAFLLIVIREVWRNQLSLSLPLSSQEGGFLFGSVRFPFSLSLS